MRHTISISIFAILIAFTACGPQPPKAESPPSTAAKTTNAAGKPSTTFELTAGDNMRFNKGLIEVPAGKEITLTLTNIGNMPKAQMGHNLVILDLKRKPQAFMAEASFAKETDYIPAGMDDWMIAHTELLGPGESDTITFTAPKIPGDYEFLCSFTGHYAIGMKGIMRVVVEVP
ncbi:plastocyanin/azurin family copper-binding protein [Cerasicoccus arenae]|uniref:Blue (type 1) copper domain-containing protein n=1 Tax=Cerasicoccus arenae TaxID=424488 RepID=A0A8J3GGC7_9BACT|nr:plastocyanin/azurin family copper-binding protein [Cerasicoccus arenae]MBK1857659.1 hypothetical protein [Cerasicoccus arenae]GHC12895.1 hypothetical protein GCM10007047_32810 [Cerasicoccus arenae]